MAYKNEQDFNNEKVVLLHEEAQQYQDQKYSEHLANEDFINQTNDRMNQVEIKEVNFGNSKLEIWEALIRTRQALESSVELAKMYKEFYDEWFNLYLENHPDEVNEILNNKK